MIDDSPLVNPKMLKVRLFYRLQDSSVKSLFSPWWSKDFDDRNQALQYYVKFLLQGSPLAEVKLFMAPELPSQSAPNVFPPPEANTLEVAQVHIMEKSASGDLVRIVIDL